MGDKFYKKVLLPITVAQGRFCFGKESNESRHRVCKYFDNHYDMKCDLMSNVVLEYDKEGNVLKPKECLELKEI